MFKKTSSLSLLLLTFSLMLSGCNSTDDKSEVEAQSGSDSALKIQASARDIATRAGKWQIEQFGNLHYIPITHREKSENPKFWIQAVFYIGLTKWTETVNDTEFLAYMDNMAKKQNYELLTDRPYHADDHTIGQTYLWLAEQTGNKDAYKPTQKQFDWILENKPNVGLEMLDETATGSGKLHHEGDCQLRWCWADALFMAPRTWLKLSNVTGNPAYFEYADKEFWAVADYLFSEKYGLFFRDSRYFKMKSENGAPVFWGRGNGWVFAALPLIIDDLPKDHPSRARYIELYKKNAAGLVKLQTEEGYWPASLMDPDLVKSPEISGTGFITYGLAWGVNEGILNDERTKKAVEKGWAVIESSVSPNGRVNWVQHVGKSPDPVKETDSQLYGVGAVLLAASEMVRWQK